MLVSAPDDAKRRSVACGGQCAGIADREDVGVLRHEFSTMSADLEIHCEVLTFDGPGFSKDCIEVGGAKVLDSIQRPEEIHGSWSGGSQDFVGFGEVCSGFGGESHAVRRRDADCRRSSNHHVADAFGHVVGSGVFEPRSSGGKNALVEHFETAIDPAQGSKHFYKVPEHRAQDSGRR